MDCQARSLETNRFVDFSEDIVEEADDYDTPTTVIEYLLFLALHHEEIARNELQTRISEIKNAYECLEQNIHTCTIPEGALIWLNIENEDLGKMAPDIF